MLLTFMTYDTANAYIKTSVFHVIALYDLLLFRQFKSSIEVSRVLHLFSPDHLICFRFFTNNHFC